MAFPASPAVNDTHQEGDITHRWTGQSWVKTDQSGAGSTNLSVGTITPTTVEVVSSTGTNAPLPASTTSDAGVMSAADKAKLDSVAAGATAITTASDVPSVAAGGLTATDVQAALEELDTEIAALETSNAADNFISTVGSPGAGDGVDGDNHLNVSTGAVTGPKAGGAWPADGNIAPNIFAVSFASATLSHTLLGDGGTATTAARSDHRHSVPTGAVFPNADGSDGAYCRLLGHATEPDGHYMTNGLHWIQIG